MGKTRAELKLRAKRALAGKYGVAAGAILMFYAILIGIILVAEICMFGFMAGYAAFGSTNEADTIKMSVGVMVALLIFMLLIFFLELMMMVGFCRMYYNICTGQKYGLKDLLFGFRNRLGKFMALIGIFILLYGAIIVAGSLTILAGPLFGVLFIILASVASIWCTLTFSQFLIILVENPELSIVDSFKTSAAIMKGNKWRLFVLYLSFIGWCFIIYITLGVAALWIAPYLGCTFTEFYLDIKKKEEPAVQNYETVVMELD